MVCLQAQPAGGGAGAAGVGEAAAAGAGGGSLDFLRNNNQFQALRQIVQANPQILQPMLQVFTEEITCCNCESPAPCSCLFLSTFAYFVALLAGAW